MTSQPTILHFQNTPRHQDALHRLMWAYRDDLAQAAADRPEIIERFYPADGYDEMIAGLPQKHALPDGGLYLIELGSEIIGSGMIHRIDDATCEIKRVYVTPAGRGTGAAETLCRFAMSHAKELGYTRMVLDTARPLLAARRLYARIGFSEIPPFYETRPETAGYVLFYGIDL